MKLYVYGISQSQIKQGAYALIMAQRGNNSVRVPIVIGVSEAQSITSFIQGVTMPRPLTHDTMVIALKAFGIRINEVFIKKFEQGVFYCDISLTDGDRNITIDSRASDAIALAIRMKAPIFIAPEVLSETSYVTNEPPTLEPDDSPTEIKLPDLERYAVPELEKMLATCVEREEYERAAEIQRIIKIKNDKFKEQQ